METLIFVLVELNASTLFSSTINKYTLDQNRLAPPDSFRGT